MRLSVLLALLAVAAAPPPPGASSCSGCHGRVVPLPTLAGRDPTVIVAALDEFRTGARKATVMDRIAKGFTHDQSVAIAIGGEPSRPDVTRKKDDRQSRLETPDLPGEFQAAHRGHDDIGQQ